MGVQVKICGVGSVEAAEAAMRAGADYVGMVFFPRSPRYLEPAQAAALAARLKGRVRLVALCVDPADAEIETIMSRIKPDALQLHGRETPQRVAALKARFGTDVIKALAVAEPGDLEHVPAYEAVADMLLFDAKAPETAARPGGHGAAFDWQLLRGRRFSRPWFLAGGLDCENVARAIASSGAPGVDVSSGVESAPGVKDPGKIREFVLAARNAQFAKEAQA